jgi:AcrR family transcriptional regulator
MGMRAPDSESDRRRRIIDAALTLADATPWHRLQLGAIAAAAGVPLAELHRHFASRTAILAGLIRQTTEAVLDEAGDTGPDASARDRLFDVLMRRFDALQPHRPALARVVRSLALDPPALLALAPEAGRALDWMLAAARVEVAGPLAAAQRAGLGLIWLGTVRVWLDDPSPDLARTMAALDSALRKAESIVAMCGCGYHGGCRGDRRGSGQRAVETEPPEPRG